MRDSIRQNFIGKYVDAYAAGNHNGIVHHRFRIAVMRASPIATWNASRAADRAPMLIALGLMMLIVASCWSAAPKLSAMSIVALGATGVSIGRWRHSAAVAPAIALHLFVYGSLYLLFVGAVWHAGASRPQRGLGLLDGVDFAISLVVMLLVVRQCLAAMAGGGDAPAR